MILELLGLSLSMAAVFKSKQANKNAAIANALNCETTAVIEHSIQKLDSASNNLINTLHQTTNLKQRALCDFTDTFVYYLKHFNGNINRKDLIDNEIYQLSKAVENYQMNIDNLKPSLLSENSMLVSAAVGGMVVGATSIISNVANISQSLELGLSFFGVGSFLSSLYQNSKTLEELAKAKYLNDNKYTIKYELDAKIDIVNNINKIFTNYNALLENLMYKFQNDLRFLQNTYRNGIITSSKNMKLVAKGKQPILQFDILNEEDQKSLYVALEKCKVLAETARAQLLTQNGEINHRGCEQLGIINE